MKKIIVCLIFLISFANAIQCYNGKNYVDIPEFKLSDLGYTKYNITHSNFDCKIAYKRYLKVKEIKPVNVSYETKSEKNELKDEPSKIGSLLPICLLVIIVCIIWIIKIAVQEKPQDELYTVIQKEPIKSKNDNTKTESDESCDDYDDYEGYLRLEQERQKKEQEYFDGILGKSYPVKLENNAKTEEQVKPKNNSVQKEPVKSWDDLSREYSEKLRKIEQERVKNGFYEIPKSKPAYTIIKNKPFNNSLGKTKTVYALLLERPEWIAYRLKVLAVKGEICEWCRSDKNLQVHHKYYLKYPNGKHIMPWQYKMEALLVLCKDCHIKAHKKYKIKSYYISY